MNILSVFLYLFALPMALIMCTIKEIQYLIVYKRFLNDFEFRQYMDWAIPFAVRLSLFLHILILMTVILIYIKWKIYM